MLQIDHVYEFLYQELFKDFEVWCLPYGVPKSDDSINMSDISIFTLIKLADRKIFFYDQEPFIHQLVGSYMSLFTNPKDIRPRILVTSEHSKNLPNNVKLLYYMDYHLLRILDILFQDLFRSAT